MAEQMTKAELLEKMRSERARWEALLAEVGEERLTEPGVAGEWSVKDIAAHLTVYERWTAGRLGGDVPPEPDAPPGVDVADLDQRNAWYYAHDRDRPLPDVLADSRRFHHLLRALVEARPEEELRAPYTITDEGELRPAAEPEAAANWPLWRLIDGNAGAHYADHNAAVRAWFDRR